MLAVGLAAAGSGYVVESRMAERRYDPSQYERSEITVPDRWAIGYYSQPLSITSDVLILALGAVPLVQSGLELRSGSAGLSQVWGDLVLYGEVVTFASAMAFYSKTVPLHPRPLAFTDKAPISERHSGDAHSSFFSVHTTGAFAAATFWGTAYSMEHPGSKWIPWIWTGGMATAAGVGALRILSGQHFPSDVLAGAAVGSAIGFAVPWLHRQKPGSGAATGGRSGSDPGALAVGLEAGLALGPTGWTPTVTLRF